MSVYSSFTVAITVAILSVGAVQSAVQYVSPYQCPSPQVLTKNCSTCAQDEVCCNSACTKGVLPPRPCNVAALAASSPLRIGAYVPQCSADGSFNPIQNWGSTGASWCVDTSDGKPLSDAAPRGTQPNCTVCSVDGKKYYPGQSFKASDGCNTCSCSARGTALCTLKACNTFTIPYRSPYECPSPKVPTRNCSTCAQDELCCDSVCTKAILPPQPCAVAVSNSYPSPLGAYVPQCSVDGNFEPVQRWGSTGYSWCVDVSTGKAISEAASPGRQPNCTVCTVNGKKFYPGQSFPASDGCNTCTCSAKGLATCTVKNCRAVFNIPYRSPYGCPPLQEPIDNCSTCAQGELCCDSVCTKAVLPPRPCEVAVTNSYPSPLGAYVPQCSTDGNFNSVQSWGSTGYSWCVDVSTGKAISDAALPGRQPNCTACTVNGKKYYPGQSFKASDGCNTCLCSTNGLAACTRMACPEPACPIAGQVFTECGSRCDATCDTPVLFCTLECVSKCQCPSGQVLDTKNNRCVEQVNCPRTVQPAPYLSPYQCPTGSKASKNCSSCTTDELCCNSVCTKGVLPAKPCQSVVLASQPTRIGAYVPQCKVDGTFEPIQRHPSTGYSWCVDVSDGKPLSTPVGPGQKPNCTVCIVGGKTQYYPGQSFMAEDGCNTCSCTQTGTSVCTKKSCVVCPIKGQTYTTCGSSCAPTCDRPDRICNAVCVSKCQCPIGTVLDTANNKCVSLKSCPKPTP